MITQANPGATYAALSEELNEAVLRVLASGQYCSGPERIAFEDEFRLWLGCGEAVGCASGTDALALALRALGVGPGSTVITVSHTAVATVAAIEQVGATPLLLDIEPEFFTISPVELETVMKTPPRELPPIRAVVPVHLYGQAADLGPILDICALHGMSLVEDCAQAHGATYCGQRVGTIGEAGAFSFYPTKNLGAVGDGGMVTVRSTETAEEIRSLREYGWRERFISSRPGINSRLDEVQAAVLRVKLKKLEASNTRRADIACCYDMVLTSCGVSPPARRSGCDHVFHQYVIRVRRRARFEAHMHSLGIGTAVHYPVPVHQQPAYARRVTCGPSGCSASSLAAREVISLPIYPEMTDAEVECVCQALHHVFTTGDYVLERKKAM